jgi:hypothetical protein
VIDNKGQPNARAPLLKAKARAGADVTFSWTKIVRMHQGPILAVSNRRLTLYRTTTDWKQYLGELPTPETKPQDVKFFKIFEQGFNASREEWANQVAVDNANQYTVQIPSDIKSGTYVLRTELIALHGNMANLNTTSLAGPQFYPYCINIDIVNGGSATPDGVKFPGAYKSSDYGIAFSPYMTYKNVSSAAGTAQNSKYVCTLLSLFSFSMPLIPYSCHPVPPNTPAPTILPLEPHQSSRRQAPIHSSCKHSMMLWL